MSKLPLLEAATLIKILQGAGFEITRQKGSHIRLKHRDGRVTTVPYHPGKEVHRGLLRKILRDIDWNVEDLLKALR